MGRQSVMGFLLLVGFMLNTTIFASEMSSSLNCAKNESIVVECDTQNLGKGFNKSKLLVCTDTKTNKTSLQLIRYEGEASQNQIVVQGTLRAQEFGARTFKATHKDNLYGVLISNDLDEVYLTITPVVGEALEGAFLGCR